MTHMPQRREYPRYVGSTFIGRVVTEGGRHTLEIENSVLTTGDKTIDEIVTPLLTLDDYRRALSDQANEWKLRAGLAELPLSDLPKATVAVVDDIVAELEARGFEDVDQKLWNAIARCVCAHRPNQPT